MYGGKLALVPLEPVEAIVIPVVAELIDPVPNPVKFVPSVALVLDKL
jgi:hypothetical protein